MNGWGRAAGGIGLIAVIGAGGCSRPVAFTARNLLLISIDALRADRLGCYGDPAARTPGWDRLARQGTPFRNAVTPATASLPAHASLLSGAQPWEHGIRRDGSADFAPPNPTLAEILGTVSLTTAACIDSEGLARRYGLHRGFEEYAERPAGEDHRRGAARVFEDALRWVRQRKPDEAFFLFVQADDAGPGFQPIRPWRSATSDSRRAQIAATDRELLRLLRGLESEGRLHRTIIIATSARGQNAAERKSTGRAASVPEAAVRVPLVLWGPLPFRGGAVRPDLARGVDVLPTALEAFRVATKANRPGRPLQKRLKPYREAALDAYAEASDDTGGDRPSARALRCGSWKYVHAEPPRLYDLATDPGEIDNRIDKEGERAAQLREQLRAKLGADLEAPAAGA